ncbi:MAG TPA: ABC transporter substrate-binding protein [Thermomicrobiales bacterium]|jgi:peptide/nickel transport system substrate-binding protein|nr:ABC transporter substrate-binding protein [Thermomicrobiales bacterium]
MSRRSVPLNRRRFIGGAAAAAAGMTFATSHAYAGGNYHGGSKYFRYQGAGLPTPREQTVVINQAETNIYDSFNPYVPNGEAITYGVHQVAREPFFIQNFMTGELVPWLASGYEYNDDYTELTLKIKPEAAWSDGEPYTSADVVFTFDMLLANETLYGGSTAAALAGWEAPDPQTVVFKFESPNPRWLLNNLSAGDWSQWIRIVPKHVWEGQDPLTFQNNPPIFSGPYTLEEARFDQRYYLWKKNPNYWNKEVQFAPEYILFRQATSADAIVQEFQRADTDVPGMEALNQQVVMSSYDQVVQASYPDPCPRGFQPNHMSPMFETPEGRWALSYLTDRDTIANTIWYPPSTPAIYPWPNWPSNEVWEIPELQQQYDLSEYNPDKAAELLDSIGIVMDGDKRKRNGEDFFVGIISPVAVGTPEYEIARLVANAAQEIGLDMQVVNLQSATYGDAVQMGNYDVESNWLCIATTDPARIATQPWYPEEGEEIPPIGERSEFNTIRANIPEFQELNEELQTVSPDDTQNPAYRRNLELFYQQLPVIPTIQTLYPFVFNTTYWTGWPDDAGEVGSTPKHDLQPFILTLANLRPAGEG